MRRTLTALAIVAGTVLGATVAAAAPGPGKARSFRAERTLDTVDQVQAALEVSGDLKTVDQGKVERMKMSVAASFVYDEKLLLAPGRGGDPTRSIRYYRLATKLAFYKRRAEQFPAEQDTREVIVDLRGQVVGLKPVPAVAPGAAPPPLPESPPQTVTEAAVEEAVDAAPPPPRYCSGCGRGYRSDENDLTECPSCHTPRG